MKKEKKDPFDLLDDKINRIMEDLLGDLEDSIVYGFSIIKRPGEEPELRELGSLRLNQGKEDTPTLEPEIIETEIIETEDKIYVTAEMPELEEEDIHLHTTPDTLEIRGMRGETEYEETVNLASPIKPEPLNITYKNGVLEVILEKKTSPS